MPNSYDADADLFQDSLESFRKQKADKEANEAHEVEPFEADEFFDIDRNW